MLISDHFFGQQHQPNSNRLKGNIISLTSRRTEESNVKLYD